jgi:hypothetical protein
MLGSVADARRDLGETLYRLRDIWRRLCIGVPAFEHFTEGAHMRHEVIADDLILGAGVHAGQEVVIREWQLPPKQRSDTF